MYNVQRNEAKYGNYILLWLLQRKDFFMTIKQRIKIKIIAKTEQG